MPEVVCQQCGLRFARREETAQVCPSCRAIDSRQKLCWRCRRPFVALDVEGITCEHCKTFWTLWSAPRI